MKRLILFAWMMVFGLALGARAEGDLPLFYEELQPEGAWFKLDGRAWVWQPKAMQLDSTWRPYVNAGSWTRHEENWFWVSEYPWGAVAFHYGRWYLSESNGWVWVPGTQWCPAWVDWQLTDTHSGWTPLQPEDAFFAALGIAPPAYEWSRYAFVPNTAFLEKDLLPYVSDGTAFADAAVSQVAGPATDRVGLQQAVVAYSETTPAYYYDTTPVTYVETEPTVFYSDARYALWWPFSYFVRCRRDHRHSSACEPSPRHRTQPPPPSHADVNPAPIHQVPEPLPPKTDRWAAPGRQQPATPPPKTDGWATPGRQPSTPPPSLPDFQPTPDRQPSPPPPSMPDFRPPPSRQPATPPPSMPDFRPTPSRQPSTPPPSKTDYRPTTSRQPSTPPPSRPSVVQTPSRQPAATPPMSPMSKPQPKLSQPPQGRPPAGSDKPK